MSLRGAALQDPDRLANFPGGAGLGIGHTDNGHHGMKLYDPAHPIIFLHIPKTAGTSLRAIMDSWFAPNLLVHYNRPIVPPRHDLARVAKPGAPIMLYGHFNMKQGVGADTYYPDIDQFITLLRAPWERIISGYFYRKGRNTDANAKIFDDLESFIRDARNLNFLNHFPRPVTADNYKDIIEQYFVATGTLEDIEPFMKTLCRVFDRPHSPDMLPRLNATPRTEGIPLHLKDDFMHNHRLEYDVYDHVRALNRDSRQPGGTAQPR